MADLLQKLTTIQGLLPSQRQWMERLCFQLEFNPFQLIHITGGPGSGKSTLCLAIAELLSDEFNLALLKGEPDLPSFIIRQHLLESWFGFCPDGNKPLMQLIGERQSQLPLALVIDQSENIPAEIWAELTEIPCLVVAASLQPDPHAELNLPLPNITLPDAEQLLQDAALSTLTVADRLDRAEGNYYVLLDPSVKPKTKTPQIATQLKPASIWPPLVTFAAGMLIIGAVVVFWLWTEKTLQPQQGLGELTYLPQEEEVATSNPAPQPANQQPESKKVVKELVEKLDVVKASSGSEAVGMAQPDRFEENSATGSAPTTTDTANADTANSDTANAEPADPTVTEPIVENVTAAKPALEANNASSEQTKAAAAAANESTTGTTGDAASLSASTNAAENDELPQENVAVQLPAETSFEDEIAAELKQVAENKNDFPANSAKSTAEAEISNGNESQAAAVEKTPSEELVIAPEDLPNKTAVNSNYRFAESTLLNLSAEAKALQLVVFSHENALNSFKQSYPQLKTYTYARTKNGQKQLVVVMAPFSDPSSAKAQIASLPAAFQNAFVKSIAEIHSEILSNN